MKANVTPLFITDNASVLGVVPAHETIHFMLCFNPTFELTDKASEQLRQSLASYDVTIRKYHAGHLYLQGQVSGINRLFGIELTRFNHKLLHNEFIGHTTIIKIPEFLQKFDLQAVSGLSTHIIAKHHHRLLTGVKQPAQHGAALTPPSVAELYQFPKDNLGQGQHIGILEFGGDYRLSDLQAYFSALGLKTPTINRINLNGASYHVGDDSGADGEVQLDIEIAASIANEAEFTVFFAANTSQAWLQAMHDILIDNRYGLSVLSISWGGPEASWSPAEMEHANQLLKFAAGQRITVCVASGDQGAYDGIDDGSAHVDFPASSPNVLACGGTRLIARDNTIEQESVWNNLSTHGGASGGGISREFAVPIYQQQISIPPTVNPGHKTGRGVPDVAGNADPSTGYKVQVNGQWQIIGGTSAVAPLYAALVACVNASTGVNLGFINNAIYQVSESDYFADITQGNNGDYQAGRGWDACTGLGRAKGQAWLKLGQTIKQTEAV